MIQTIRPFRSLLLASLLCGTATASLLAQRGPGGQPPGGPDQRDQREEHGPHHHGPPPSPLFDALDTNHDGVLSADEMNNAPTALKGLLIPGSNELRREDLHPVPKPPRGDEADGPAADRAEHVHRRPMMRPRLLPHPPVDRDADEVDQDRPDVEDAPRPHRHGGPEMNGGPRPHRHGGPEVDKASRPHDDSDADDAPKPGGPEADSAPKGPHHPHDGPRPNPVFDALDTDHNGILSSEEMSKANDTLKGLLKDGATQLRREEVRPAQPPQTSSTSSQPDQPPQPQGQPPQQ